MPDRPGLRSTLRRSALAAGLALAGAPPGIAAGPAEALDTATPIKHLIVVVGENRSFDHVFGIYMPRADQSVANLLSKGIVRADGTPGPNFAAAAQFAAKPQPRYFIGLPVAEKSLYPALPPPALKGAPFEPRWTRPPFVGRSGPALSSIEPALAPGDLNLLTTGATGAGAARGPDARIAGGASLPNGPFRLTGPSLPYDSYTGDTVHRFFHMWQQSDCALANATPTNPSGCLADLYPFVATTAAGGREEGGGNAMAIYDMAAGDAPLLRRLADEYALADNYHQPAMGGTAIQHVFIGSGDNLFWTDEAGNPARPPEAVIADPEPRPGSNNHYTRDGRFADCNDAHSPGVAAILDYLAALPYRPASRCEPGHFYMLNNTSVGFLPNGAVDIRRIARGFALPPSRVRTIGDALNETAVGWAYYGGGWHVARATANGSPSPSDRSGAAYCDVCNFAQYTVSIMADPAPRAAHIGDITDAFEAIEHGELPPVAFVKPDEIVDGHPATSKLDLFEAMIAELLRVLAGNPALAATTAVLITFDEGGGFYDSGYIQPLDFFGDGPRVPLIAVSPWSRGGRVMHGYADHVSILKFIERNWHLAPLTGRSRDNLPNPAGDADNPYVPTNPPAIGDLFDLFDFAGAK